MIPLAAIQEPKDFDNKVRSKGRKFLSTVPNPSYKDFKGKDYWKSVAVDLYLGYRRICSYSCVYIPTSPGVVDHYLPKTKYPSLSYEWSNYRLALDRINQYKGSSDEVLDPLTIQMGWFVLDFPSCLVKVGDGLDDDISVKVAKTILILKLNDDDGLVQGRCDIILDLIDGNVNMDFISRHYPFVANEIKRQNIENDLKNIFKKNI